MQHDDELFHYLWLKPKVTGVAVDIFVDDGGTYKIDKHPLVAFVRNGYGRDVDKFIAIGVEGEQEILSVGMETKITTQEMMAARIFLKENHVLLKELADGIKSHEEFFEQMKPVWKDDFGGVYTVDKKRLLVCPDVKRYRIVEGCEETDEHAFDECKVLEVLYMPVTYSEEEVDKTLNIMPETVDNVCAWDRSYVEEVYDVNEYWHDEAKTTMDMYGVVYANEGRRLLMATRPELIGKEYVVPDGVLTICDGAFNFCKDYLVLSLPWSIEVIGDYIFGKESGRIKIRKK